MVLGFSTTWNGSPTGFVDHVMSGRKWHTLRWGRRWRAGMSIQFATGVRTKNYRCFAVGTVHSVQPVKIIPAGAAPGRNGHGVPHVMVERGPNGVLQPLAPFEIMALSINDGFDTVGDFNLWFAQACKANKTDAFRGQIVAWVPFTKSQPETLY